MDLMRMFQFSGRINRGTFWLMFAVILGIAVVSALLVAMNDFLGVVGYLLGIAAYLAAIWISLATSVKRWHDRGKSGWWMFISLVPVIGGIWALVETGFLAGQDGPNQYGQPDSGSPFAADSVAHQPA